MFKKVHINLFILFFICFAIPSSGFACETKSNTSSTSCCNEKKSNNVVKKNCCTKKYAKPEKNNGGCDGKCNNKSCNCSTVQFVFCLLCSNEIMSKPYFVEYKKAKAYYKENYHSSVFYSIWTPPKIA